MQIIHVRSIVRGAVAAGTLVETGKEWGAG